MNDVYGNSYILLHGDCIQRYDEVIPSSVDLVLQDPPYGTTRCEFDVIIPFDKLWEMFVHTCHRNTALTLFGIDPFKSLLVTSNPSIFRYNIYWNTRKAANFLFGNKQPLRKVEPISVFYWGQPTYNPKKLVNNRGPERPERSGFGSTIHDHMDRLPGRHVAGKSYEADKLLPDDVIDEHDISGLMLPFSKPQRPLHPTQKPVPLLRYIIETYTDPDDLVFDPTMGSGSTGVAAILSGRRFIGIERDSTYFLMAVDRMARVSNGDLEIERGFTKELEHLCTL